MLRMVNCGENGTRCGTEQVTLFVGPNWLLSFQEGRPGDSFNAFPHEVMLVAANTFAQPVPIYRNPLDPTADAGQANSAATGGFAANFQIFGRS